ncbi:MAG: DUF3857 domain-containing protein [Candidatus Brachytrichaceae bacterium NZ_4S206]
MCLAVLAALATSLALATASAQREPSNPWDAEQRRLAAEVRRSATQPRAAVPLARMVDLWAQASPGVTTQLLGELASDRRLPASLRSYAAALRATLRVREGQLEEAASTFRELGFVTQVRVIGPFDNEGKAGFDRVMPPETAQNAPFDPGVSYDGRERPVSWRPYPDVGRWGYVNFAAVMRPAENVCAFAETFVISEREQPLTLWVGAGGAVRVWFNGAEVVRDDAYRNGDFDRSVALVPARAGANRVLAKVCTASGSFGLYLRLGDAQGGPATGIRVDPDGAREAAPPPARALTLPRAPRAPLAGLLAEVEARPDSAQAHEDLARFLSLTFADDPADRRALREAERAAELQPTWQRWLLVSNLRTERAEVMRAVDDAERLAPSEPEVLYARAWLVASGPDPDRALRILERIDPRTTTGLSAAMFRAGLLRELGLPRAALGEVERGYRQARGSVAWIRERLRASTALGRVEEPMRLREELLQAARDDGDARRALVEDAFARHDRARVLAEVDAARALFPDDADTMSWAASVYEALGMVEQALAARREVIELAPEDGGALVAYARTLVRQDQSDAASQALMRALELRPQDEAARALLEEIRPASPRRDERFAAPSEQILARRREAQGWPATVLQDLTVNTVFENGLGSSFRQIATQVHDAEGARAWRSYSIAYDPATQWVEVRSARVVRPDGTVLESVRTGSRALGDPRYRIYYARQAHVVTFPELRAGDTIELRYRVTDIAPRNLFHDYYGDFRILQNAVPTVRMEYVLVTPEARRFFFNEPRLPSLRRTRTQEEGTNVDRFVAEDVPALRVEPSMPGPSETMPYLHVSTYESWADVGRWWWGLVRDHLVSDPALTRTVNELVAGATTTRERVERIYAWVIRNTRYVGLEFGIHGYLPYRVPLVVQRGFGDCKDKAALLYVMLREAGIDARMVLVRTRGNGDIDEAPASLAVFDHAIAYVPELDLYLDGTAENGGTNALPSGDQGVRVLVVGPDQVELRRTPMSEPDRAVRSIELSAELAADGSARIEESHEVVGPVAAAFRTHYQPERTRVERLQQSFAEVFPGIEVEAPTFENLDALELPVRFRYRARVPQLAQRDGASLLLAPSRLAPLTTSLGLGAERRHALDLGSRSTFRERRRVRLPAGARVTETPPGGVAESPFGRCEVRYTVSGGLVEITTELVWRRDRIPREEYEAFRRWVSEVDVLLRARVRIEGGAR